LKLSGVFPREIQTRVARWASASHRCGARQSGTGDGVSEPDDTNQRFQHLSRERVVMERQCLHRQERDEQELSVSCFASVTFQVRDKSALPFDTLLTRSNVPFQARAKLLVLREI